ncbi:MAG: DUF309 domain-containing protein [Myxococcota bacterium]
MHADHHFLHPRDPLGRPLPKGAADQMPKRRVPDETISSTSAALDIAVPLFEEQRFFEAHEFFEHIWKLEDVAQRDRDFWKGLTQVAAAYCHVQRNNLTGAVTLLGRAAQLLAKYPSPHLGINVQRLLDDAKQVRARLGNGPSSSVTFPRFPRVLH